MVKGFGGAHARVRDMYTAILPPNVVRQACVRFAGVARVCMHRWGRPCEGVCTRDVCSQVYAVRELNFHVDL